jgi:hypothetical protein
MATKAREAGGFEVWAARAWNVFNEGKPFGVVYPPMALAGAILIGAVQGRLLAALAAGLAVSLVWARFPFALRGRALLWVMLIPALVVLGAPGGLTAVGLGGWLFFTVVVWGSIYYHLRTGAPWTNGLRFWRLVATNSDPTSGNALEQVPKLTMTFAAMEHVAGGGGAVPVAGLMAVAAVLGVLARRWERRPWYPEREAQETGPALARRVYVIVVDGCNRDRLRQASALGLTPTLDRLAAEGSEYLDVRTAAPARTVVCFSSMLTGATPAEHGMRSNFAPRLGVRVPSIFASVHGRLVGIAHLIDPFGEEIVRSVTSVQPTEQLDHSLAAAGRAVVEEEDPDLLVLQLLAADQLGHVRGTRNPEYLQQIAETDRRIEEFLDFLEARGRLRDAAVIVMADHGQGRGIGGHGHLDWGESPVPYIHWGAGAVPGGVSDRPASVCELAVTLARLLGVEAPAHARGRPLLDAVVPPGGGRALAIVTGGGAEGLPREVAGVPLDARVFEDLRTGLAVAREEGYVAALHFPAESGYLPEQAERLLEPVLRGRAAHVAGSRFLGRREGMGRGESVRHRIASAILGFRLGGHVVTDARTSYRAFSLDSSLSLQSPALELPVDFRASRATTSTSAATTPAATASAHADPTP